VASEQDGVMVGFIFHDTTEDNIVFFRKVVVGREMRRRGIGRRLAERAIADLKLRSHWPCAIRLLVLRSNEAAVHMYTNFGMKPTRIIKVSHGLLCVSVVLVSDSTSVCLFSFVFLWT
jgi:ribosomal protein S18 acetylase RimI-like enzyme